MAVQDDRRETDMRRLIGLRAGQGRSGVDAFLDFSTAESRYSVPVELKSSTNWSVSTARDVGPAHIAKWRSQVWVFGFYDASGTELKRVLTLGPDDMEPWIGRIERYIAPDFAIGDRIAHRLTLEDLHIICGEKPIYSIEDAQALHKRQWHSDMYAAQMDMSQGYSPGRMLDILKLRARYLNARGATLNNPHIPKTFFAGFLGQIVDAGTSEAGVLRATIRANIRSITLANETLRRTSAYREDSG